MQMRLKWMKTDGCNIPCRAQGLTEARRGSRHTRGRADSSRGEARKSGHVHTCEGADGCNYLSRRKTWEPSLGVNEVINIPAEGVGVFG